MTKFAIVLHPLSNPKPVCKKKSIIYYDLMRQSFQMKGEEIVLRFETKQQLYVLSSIVGVCCYVGVRKKRPPIRESRNICYYDTLNAVPGSDSIEFPVNHFTVLPGIDLIHYSDQYKRNEFFVKVRYKSIANDNNFDYDALWPNNSSSFIDTRNVSAVDCHSHIKVGNILQIEETVFTIVSVTPIEATLQAMNNTNLIRKFPQSEFQYLDKMLMDYNM